MNRLRWLIRNLGRAFVRFLLRVGLLPASTKADTDTMGEYKRLMAEKDDPRPGLVLPDPNAPHADLIRRVRLYAQNGAKALAPLLDNPLPTDWDAEEPHRPGRVDQIVALTLIAKADSDAAERRDFDAMAITNALLAAGFDQPSMLLAIHTAYNSPWTVIDGEVYEYESERKKRVVQ